MNVFCIQSPERVNHGLYDSCGFSSYAEIGKLTLGNNVLMDLGTASQALVRGDLASVSVYFAGCVNCANTLLVE